jgi:hypothetical protein
MTTPLVEYIDYVDVKSLCLTPVSLYMQFDRRGGL